MKKLIILPFSIFLLAFACQGQNGPTVVTPPSVTLTWVQSGTPGVTKNCVYRGAVVGVYGMPAVFCSAGPVVSWVDSGVARGMTYHYAVTAQTGTGAAVIESQYSVDVAVTVPAAGTTVVTVTGVVAVAK